MPASRKSSSSISSCSSPLMLLGLSLVAAQIMIFYIGMSYFRAESNMAELELQASTSRNLEHPPHRQAYGPTTSKASVAKKKRPKVTQDANADGSFNGYPIYYRSQKGRYSLSHCVGENYQERKAWMHRSCRFSFLCFDTDKKEYVVFQSPEETNFLKHQDRRAFLDVSQSFMRKNSTQINTMSLGGKSVSVPSFSFSSHRRI